MDSESRLVAPGAAAGERAGLVRGAGSQLRDEGAPGGQRRAAGLQVVEKMDPGCSLAHADHCARGWSVY